MIVALAIPLLAIALYQLLLAVAAFFYRPKSPRATGPHLLVLIPAHDEAGSIARCVRALRAQTYDVHRFDVVVVADNCTDDTAQRAEAAGARVLVRHEPAVRGKGQALRWALDRLLAEPQAPEAVVIIDADSEAAPEFLAALAAHLDPEVDAVQGESLLVPDGSPASLLRSAAFLLVNRTRPKGRAVIGAASHLAGNGMLIRSQVLRDAPWDAFTSAEDLEYAVTLRMRGISPRFAGGAIVYSPTAPNPTAAAQQQLRWEGGKAHLARTWIPRLLRAAMRERRLGLLELALELAVPPLGFLTAAVAVGAIGSGALVVVGAVRPWAFWPWLAALATIPGYVLVGLAAADAPGEVYAALVRAPVLVVRKLPALASVLRFRSDSWVRTERAADDEDNEH